MNISAWVQAARLRTLPLSVSGILLGSFYALSQSYFNWKIIGLALLTTLELQILSNLANDYGDGVKGTDNEDRVGPKRTVQTGIITAKEMKKGILITSLMCFISILLLIYVSFGIKYLKYSLFFTVLGILAILAAIKYTVGRNAYGYSGWGDFFVFIFFGLVSTLGTYFLFAKEIDYLLIYPASAIGLLSSGVLNLNNMRDVVSDQKAGKNTFVVKFGLVMAKKYHYFLILVALLLFLFFAVLNQFRIDQYLFLIAYIPILYHLKTVYHTGTFSRLDSQLGVLALSTFLVSVLVSVCLIF